MVVMSNYIEVCVLHPVTGKGCIQGHLLCAVFLSWSGSVHTWQVLSGFPHPDVQGCSHTDYICRYTVCIYITPDHPYPFILQSVCI
ncbi:hypothetical protein GDO81_017913 [Engystomops pustulosus]|uniref:Uncharacterized protein n=1 Tax=Engystomops pustulosus TaxID=76066 RepID=A0AAV7A3B9_ENGPU|nr:hypothetical protein GDO81_017913 [Engystomops pustulosus]